MCTKFTHERRLAFSEKKIHMKSQQNTSMKNYDANDVKTKILSLLDEGVKKEDILHALQNEFEITNSDLRNVIRGIRADFIQKLNVLQPGALRL